MKGAIQLSWKVIVGIIVAIIAIVIISVLVFSLVTGRNLAEGAVVLCKQVFEQVFGKGNPIAGVCDIFTRG